MNTCAGWGVVCFDRNLEYTYFFLGTCKTQLLIDKNRSSLSYRRIFTGVPDNLLYAFIGLETEIVIVW